MNRSYKYVPGEKLSYQEAWRNYRRRRNLFWAISLTYVPGVAVTGVPLSRVFQTEVPVFVIATLWLLAFAVWLPVQEVTLALLRV